MLLDGAIECHGLELLLLALAPVGDGQIVVRHDVPFGEASHVLVVGNHRGDLDRQRAGVPAVQDAVETMSLTRYGNQRPAAASDFVKAPSHPEAPADFGRELAVQVILCGGPKRALLKAPVAYYVMGREPWRHAQSLEDITERHQSYFLDFRHNQDDVFRSGTPGYEPATGGPDTHHYDVRDTSGLEIEAKAGAAGGSLVDQALLLALQGRQLIYHTEPFRESVEISGFFRLAAWISISQSDADLYVAVHDVGPDGSSVRLSTDALRARYRLGLRKPAPVRTHVPIRYDF